MVDEKKGEERFAFGMRKPVFRIQNTEFRIRQSISATFKYELIIRAILKNVSFIKDLQKSCFNHHLSLEGETKRGCFSPIKKTWFLQIL